MTSTVELPDALGTALRAANRVCVLTGAGVSAESGVPTFRDAQTGLWSSYDPMQLATLDAFLDDPELVWRWYRWRRELVAGVSPNPAHVAIAELETLYEEFLLVTQNVDGLHAAAGSQRLVEFHGNLFRDVCLGGCDLPDADAASTPTCPACGELLRPGVVWFGEAIPEHALEAATESAARCDVMLVVGTSSAVYPAAGLADLAGSAGAVTAEINPEPSGNAVFDFVLPGPAGLILPELVASLRNTN